MGGWLEAEGGSNGEGGSSWFRGEGGEIRQWGQFKIMDMKRIEEEGGGGLIIKINLGIHGIQKDI